VLTKDKTITTTMSARKQKTQNINKIRQNSSTKNEDGNNETFSATYFLANFVAAAFRQSFQNSSLDFFDEAKTRRNHSHRSIRVESVFSVPAPPENIQSSSRPTTQKYSHFPPNVVKNKKQLQQLIKKHLKSKSLCQDQYCAKILCLRTRTLVRQQFSSAVHE